MLNRISKIPKASTTFEGNFDSLDVKNLKGPEFIVNESWRLLSIFHISHELLAGQSSNAVTLMTYLV